MPKVGLALAIVAGLEIMACDRPPERQAVEQVTASPGPAAALGAVGELVFQSDREGHTRIYALDLASGAVRALTTDEPWRDESPRPSPDGRQVAFSSNRDNPGVFEIYVMDADGGNVRRLTHFADDPATARNERHAMDPTWGPDGWVYFAWGRSGQEDIYRGRATSGTPEQVTDTLTRAIMPAVSPDGRYLAYALQSIRKLGAFQIEVLDLSTRKARVIGAAGGACRPAWSPDGRRLAYVVLDEEPSTIDIVDVASGKAERVFADPKLWAYYPAFSADGRFLTFSISPEHHEGEDWDIALMDLTKPGRFVRVTSGPGNDRLADWR